MTTETFNIHLRYDKNSCAVVGRDLHAMTLQKKNTTITLNVRANES